MKKNKIWLYLLFLMILLSSAKSQTTNTVAPILKFLQKNADSSFVFEHCSSWLRYAPEYLILIKKQDTLSAFVYDGNYRKDEKFNLLPKVFRDTLLRKNREMRIMTPIGINHLFTPKYLEADSLRVFWRSLIKLNLWNITDDTVDGIGCPISNDRDNNGLETDQNGMRLYLITKTQIKALEFYAPLQAEEICPGRKGRQTILKVEKVFQDYLKE